MVSKGQALWLGFGASGPNACCLIAIARNQNNLCVIKINVPRLEISGCDLNLA